MKHHEIEVEMPPKQKTGKPTKFTKETVAQILAYIRNGNYAESAALACGVAKRTLTTWRSKFPTFDEAIRLAESQAECIAVKKILCAGKKDPRYLQWFLSRKHYERWGDQRHDILELRKDIEILKNALQSQGVGTGNQESTETTPDEKKQENS